MKADPLRRLEALLKDLAPGVVVAFSGGVDSSLLLAAAVRTLGSARVLAATADSPSLPARDRADAVALARRLGVRHLLVATAEMLDDAYRRNDSERCYHCKRHLFETLAPLARDSGLPHLAFGALVDDLADDRPGHRAAVEFSVRAPLLEAGLTKEDVRLCARRLGLSTWDKPSSACLASRVFRGIEVEPRLLARVERAEQYLHGLGFRQVRVRHLGDTARIEVEPAEVERLRSPEILLPVRRRLSELGWRRVDVDPEGYRSPGLRVAQRRASSQVSNARAGR